MRQWSLQLRRLTLGFPTGPMTSSSSQDGRRPSAAFVEARARALRVKHIFADVAQANRAAAHDPFDRKRRKLISEDPMVFVKNLREPKGDVDPFTLEEAERLIKTATGQDRALITVPVLCGLRPNEALALHWKDVDFDREQLRIRRSIHRFAGIGLPKTTSSEREVDMLAPVVEELREQRARTQLCGDLVFLNENEAPLDLTNFRERNWR